MPIRAGARSASISSHASGAPSNPCLGACSISRSVGHVRLMARSKRAEPLAFARTADGKGYLVWVARVRYMDPEGAEQLDDILADAITGKLAQRLPRIHHALNRRVNDERTGAVLILKAVPRRTSLQPRRTNIPVIPVISSGTPAGGIPSVLGRLLPSTVIRRM